MLDPTIAKLPEFFAIPVSNPARGPASMSGSWIFERSSLADFWTISVEWLSRLISNGINAPSPVAATGAKQFVRFTCLFLCVLGVVYVDSVSSHALSQLIRVTPEWFGEILVHPGWSGTSNGYSQQCWSEHSSCDVIQTYTQC